MLRAHPSKLCSSSTGVPCGPPAHKHSFEPFPPLCPQLWRARATGHAVALLTFLRCETSTPVRTGCWHSMGLAAGADELRVRDARAAAARTASVQIERISGTLAEEQAVR